MEGLRVSGLMSGMDTDAIIEAYMTSAKAPITRLNQQIEELNYEKTTYNNFITMITDIKNSMLSLKMESTFKSKTTTSSVETVASATASITTPPGTYTLKVDQVAEPAYATSIYTNKILTKTGAGVSSFTPSYSQYDQQEGTHTVDIYKGSNYGYDKWFAKDTFKGNLNNTYMVNHADKADKALVDGNGDLKSGINGEFYLIYKYNGEQYDLPIKMEYSKGTSINKIAADLDSQLNAQLDAIHSNDGAQKMKVTINLDDEGFNFSFYDVDTQNNIEILEFIDINDKGDPTDPSYQPTPTTKLINKLGLQATYKSMSTKEITNIMVVNPSIAFQAQTIDETIYNKSNKKIKTDIEGNFELKYEYNGIEETISINMDYEAEKSLDEIAADITKQINQQLSAKHGINNKISIKVSSENGIHFSFHNSDTASNLKIKGMVPVNDPTNPTTDEAKLLKKLGLDYMKQSQSTGTLLQMKLNSEEQGGFFAPGTLEFGVDGLQEGSFQIYQDSSAICRPETYTTFYGDTFDKIENANPAVDRKEINEWLNTKIGSTTSAGNTFFDDGTVFSNLNGVFYINGVKIEIEDYTKLTPNELMAKVNSSGAGVTMSYDYEKNIFQISNNKGGAAELTLGNDTDTSQFFKIFKVGLNSGATYVRGHNKGSLDTSTTISRLDPSFTYPIKSGTFTINGVSIYIDIDNDSINDVINKVNKSGANVIMTYDSTTDKFSLTSTNGERIKVGGANDTSTFLLSAGLLYNQTTETTIGTEGKDAIFTMNGVKYTRDSNEVNDVVPGMSFTINTTGTTVFNVKIDTDKAVTALAEFASKYNTLINALNPTEIAYNDDLRKKYSEPLTDDKKEKMSEDEIKKYQENYEKVQYYDLVTKSSELRALKTNIRSKLTMTINSENSKYSSITEVGITIAGSATRDIKVTKLGLLFDVSTDTKKLEEYIKENSDFVSILSENPDDVYYFFTDSETVYEKDENDKETSKVVNIGWAKVYSDFLDTNINSSSALYKKTSTNGTIESEISSLKEQVESQTNRVEMYLERLYAQFTAMEERLSTLQQSASYLANLSTNNASQ